MKEWSSKRIRTLRLYLISSPAVTIDQRFYNSMVVIYNISTGKRRYWKLRGKRTFTMYVDTGNEGPVTLHILLVPTPHTDYAGGRHFESNTFMFPIPIYSYLPLRFLEGFLRLLAWHLRPLGRTTVLSPLLRPPVLGGQ